MTDDVGQVLEFDLGGESYCVSIDHVAEIVDAGSVTAVPNAPAHVEGVMDLRGRTTTIVDPKRVFGVDGTDDADRVVVFEAGVGTDGGAAGWLVDEVHQVVRVTADQVDDPPTDDGAVLGLVRRDDDFVVWVDPGSVHAG